MKKRLALWGLAWLVPILLLAAPSSSKSSSKSASNSKSAVAQSEDALFVDYAAYGTFENVGTQRYRYTITDRAGLSEAVGAGIFPNTSGLYQDLEFKKAMRQKKLEGPLENFRPESDPQLAFYKWGSLKGVPFQGLRLTNIAQALELTNQPKRALTAYYSIVVNFPKEIAWQSNSPWYVGVSALDSVYRLLEAHPEWNLTLEGASIQIQNGFDTKATNDVFSINPGRWVKGPVAKAEIQKMGEIDETPTLAEVRFVQHETGDWQLLVKNRPYLIRGICYSPSPVGRSPDLDSYQPHADWMNADENGNGRIDSPYDAFVDANKNNEFDSNEKPTGDFELMRQMGANTIRLYHHAENKQMLRDLTNRYGIKVLMGDLVGAYTIGSGAEWEKGTDYENARQREKMRHSVWRMVQDHKDEPYVLMWVLGNENNYGHGNNAKKFPVTYYRFINALAKMIKLVDPKHPVALSNGDLENLDLIALNCPSVDVLAINAYRGEHGMGESFWSNISTVWQKPVFIGEFGAPAFNTVQDAAQAEETQAKYLISNWNDIEAHSYGRKIGNSVGGCIFEWVDEWWKAGPQYEPWVQDESPQSRGAFVGGWMYEEWLGITSQGDGQKSPYLRQLRTAYTQFKEGPWKEPMNFSSETSSVWSLPKDKNEN